MRLSSVGFVGTKLFSKRKRNFECCPEFVTQEASSKGAVKQFKTASFKRKKMFITVFISFLFLLINRGGRNNRMSDRGNKDQSEVKQYAQLRRVIGSLRSKPKPVIDPYKHVIIEMKL